MPSILGLGYPFFFTACRRSVVRSW